MKFTYPPEPPRPAPKPKRPLPGRKPAPMPTHSLWMIHDPAIYRDPVSGDYFLYCTNARILRSQDLITWESLGKAVEEPPA